MGDRYGDESLFGVLSWVEAVPGETLQEKLAHLEEEARQAKARATWWRSGHSYKRNILIIELKDMIVRGDGSFARWRENKQRAERHHTERQEHQDELLRIAREAELRRAQQHLDNLTPKPTPPPVDPLRAVALKKKARLQEVDKTEAECMDGVDRDSPHGKRLLALFAKQRMDIMDEDE